MPHELIQCGNHQLAPWSVVCVHLIAGESREWLPVPSTSKEVEYDWLCPECMQLHDNGIDDLARLRPICIHCVRTLRAKFDENYSEADL